MLAKSILQYFVAVDIKNNDKSVMKLPLPGDVLSKFPWQLLYFAGENF
jgi:hypothetical protein